MRNKVEKGGERGELEVNLSGDELLLLVNPNKKLTLELKSALEKSDIEKWLKRDFPFKKKSLFFESRFVVESEFGFGVFVQHILDVSLGALQPKLLPRTTQHQLSLPLLP